MKCYGALHLLESHAHVNYDIFVGPVINSEVNLESGATAHLTVVKGVGRGG